MALRGVLFLSFFCALSSFALGFYYETQISPLNTPLPENTYASIAEFRNDDQWVGLYDVSGEALVKAYRSLEAKELDSPNNYKLPKLGKHFRTRKGWAQRITCQDSPNFSKPLLSRMTSRYGRRSNPFGRYTSIHAGLDFRGPVGMPIQAAANGFVSYARKKGRYGNTVIITHKNGFTTLYGHLSDYAVKEGEKISKGQTLGFVGRTGRVTGPHLHFEVRCYKIPVDPLVYLKRKGKRAIVSVLRRNYQPPAGQRYISRKQRILRSRQKASIDPKGFRAHRSEAF